jgi:hypothetical protein
MGALAIRQPYAELILREIKTGKLLSRATTIASIFATEVRNGFIIVSSSRDQTSGSGFGFRFDRDGALLDSIDGLRDPHR